jgi:hypothetical protein
LIVQGDLKITGNGNGVYRTPVPVKANLEYKKIDNPAVSEYPADNGLGVTSAFYNFGDGARPVAGDKDGMKGAVTLNGFIYVTGSLSGAGDQIIHGAIWVNPQGSGTQGHFMIFYRDDLVIKTSQVSPTFTILSIKTVPAP